MSVINVHVSAFAISEAKQNAVMLCVMKTFLQILSKKQMGHLKCFIVKTLR